MVKRTMDLVLAGGALIALAPLLLLIALGIKLDSAGPVLYSQIRIGRGGRPFRLHKFRSMLAGADRRGPPLTRGDDARVTRLGRVLRPLRLDELPQLFNVLTGDMSLVGPRPEIPSIVERYTSEEREVLSVRPGLAGPTHLAWLDEAERYPAGVDPVEYYVAHMLPQKLRGDLEYVRTRTLLMDIGCLMRVPPALVRSALRSRRVESLARKAARLALDSLGVCLATVVAFMLRFDWNIPDPELPYLLYGLPVAGAAYALAFLTLGTYRSVWQYFMFEDLWHVCRAALLGGGLHASTVFLLGWRSYPRSVLVLTGLLTIAFLSATRLVTRSAARRRAVPDTRSGRRRVVVIGAGTTGAALCRAIREDPALDYEPVGFLDDDVRLAGETIHNLPVFGTTADLARVVREHRVQEAIVAIPSGDRSELRRLAGACRAAGVGFRTLPSLTQLVRGEGTLRYLGPLQTEDLLRREPLAIDREPARAFLRGKRVMVTGAGGSIGSELCRQALALGVESLVMVERAENTLHDIALEVKTRYPEAAVTTALADVADAPEMREIFRRGRPQVVFHAAAYKQVPLLEDHPREAVRNNVIATRSLARVAREFATEAFVFISTDKAVNVSSVMGATKRISEMYLTAWDAAAARNDGASTRFTVVRFGNVLGSAGSVVPLFRRQVEDGEPLTITDPRVSRFFMTITEAAGLVMLSATLEGPGSIFVLDMGEPMKITDLADNLVRALGLSPADVSRRYVGLRPGDKLHETLWEVDDEILPSPYERILVIRPRVRPRWEMEALVDRLETLAAAAGDVERLVEEVYAAARADRAVAKGPQHPASP